MPLLEVFIVSCYSLCQFNTAHESEPGNVPAKYSDQLFYLEAGVEGGIYAACSCPSDTSTGSTVCRGLSGWMSLRVVVSLSCRGGLCPAPCMALQVS